MAADIELRRASPADLPAILGLLHASMGWPDDDRSAAFFAWKHHASPFGPSPAWVAVAGERLVGLRTFLRWELVDGDRLTTAVRAVDTATHPQYQGQGIFSRLTRRALDELADEGVALVFNTPNGRSSPGYRKMGWRAAGRLPVRFRPRSPAVAPRVLRAGVPAERWSLATEAGEPAVEVLADHAAVDRLLSSVPTTAKLHTRRSPRYLSWRYGFAPLHYRAVLAGASIEQGMATFRLRRRASAVEAAVCEVLVPGDDRRVARSLLGKVLASSRADYAVLIGARAGRGLGLLPLPGRGPVLMWRPLARDAWPDPVGFELGLGDIELF